MDKLFDGSYISLSWFFVNSSDDYTFQGRTKWQTLVKNVLDLSVQLYSGTLIESCPWANVMPDGVISTMDRKWSWLEAISIHDIYKWWQKYSSLPLSLHHVSIPIHTNDGLKWHLPFAWRYLGKRSGWVGRLDTEWYTSAQEFASAEIETIPCTIAICDFHLKV